MDDLEYAAKLIAKLFILCSPDVKDRDKLFRRLHPGIGDYRGTGYAFLDAFDEITSDFSEKAGDLLYRKVRETLEEERIKKEKLSNLQ